MVAIRRTELKFILSAPSARILRSRLSAVLPYDAFACADGQYHIRSLYFDDGIHSSYFDKLAGVSERKKIRLRYYNGDQSFLRLEEKEKSGDLSEKTGVRVTREEALALCERQCGTGPFSHPLLEDVSRKIRTGVLFPCLFVDYERTAFCHPLGDLRVTLDERVTSSSFRGDLFEEGAGIPIMRDDQVILEVKYNGVLPEMIVRMIEDIPKVGCSVSKFTLCTEILN